MTYNDSYAKMHANTLKRVPKIYAKCMLLYTCPKNLHQQETLPPFAHCKAQISDSWGTYSTPWSSNCLWWEVHQRHHFPGRLSMVSSKFPSQTSAGIFGPSWPSGRSDWAFALGSTDGLERAWTTPGWLVTRGMDDVFGTPSLCQRAIKSLGMDSRL